jgi:hypothetical protein
MSQMLQHNMFPLNKGELMSVVVLTREFWGGISDHQNRIKVNVQKA